MKSILDENIVLSLNANWQALGVKSVRDAITQLCSSEDGVTPAALALDFHYLVKDDGMPDYTQLIGINPVPWDAWVTLPIRPWDSVVRTAKSVIRVPTVVVAAHFAKMPDRTAKVSNNAIRIRDNDTCQVSGKKLKKGDGNIDHIVPQSRGGRDTWENLVYMDKTLNSQKGDRTLSEMGWNLVRKPVAPRPIPLSATVREARHKDWEHFIIK